MDILVGEIDIAPRRAAEPPRGLDKFLQRLPMLGLRIPKDGQVEVRLRLIRYPQAEEEPVRQVTELHIIQRIFRQQVHMLSRLNPLPGDLEDPLRRARLRCGGGVSYQGATILQHIYEDIILPGLSYQPPVT